MQGEFTVQKIVCGGDPEEGDRITIHLRAADYVDKLKAHASKHYDDKTYGDIIEDVAKQAGPEAGVDSDVAKIKAPYRLRGNQSHIDFATELSEEVGAICKPAGGKLIAVKRGGGKSASGKNLTPIEIRRRKGFAYEIEIEPHPKVGEVMTRARGASTAPACRTRTPGRRSMFRASNRQPLEGRDRRKSLGVGRRLLHHGTCEGGRRREGEERVSEAPAPAPAALQHG